MYRSDDFLVPGGRGRTLLPARPGNQAWMRAAPEEGEGALLVCKNRACALGAALFGMGKEPPKGKFIMPSFGFFQSLRMLSTILCGGPRR